MRGCSRLLGGLGRGWLRRLLDDGVVLFGEHRRADLLLVALATDDSNQVGSRQFQVMFLTESIELLQMHAGHGSLVFRSRSRRKADSKTLFFCGLIDSPDRADHFTIGLNPPRCNRPNPGSAV